MAKKIEIDEIKRAVAASGLKLNYVAEYLGISTSSLNNKLNGATDFKLQELNQLNELFGIF